MTPEEYDKRLHLLLGVSGPMSFMQIEGVSFLTYKLPDGKSKDLPCPQDMTPEQRQATIDELTRHLGVIAKRRRNSNLC